LGPRRRKAVTVTIHDVSRRAGVSVKTVSRAINNHPDVSVATRAAVLEVVRELGFQPNMAARGLRKGRTGMIGLLIPDMLNPHFAEFARQMQVIAYTHDFMLVLSNYQYDEAVKLTNLRSFIAHHMDGLIWMAGALEGEALEMMQGARLPLVLCEEPAPANLKYAHSFMCGATRDQATYDIVSRLIQHGHRRVAYLTGGNELPTAHGRLSAYCQALNDHGLPVDEGLIKRTIFLQGNNLEAGYKATHEFFDEGQSPTAICTLNDFTALGVLSALSERGLRVPTDVSVVGCDDILQASYTRPPLTTIHTPIEAISKQVLKLLQQLISSKGDEEPVSLDDTGSTSDIRYTLVERASTGLAPGYLSSS
jgi:LacI family transcriptional regulator